MGCPQGVEHVLGLNMPPLSVWVNKLAHPFLYSSLFSLIRLSHVLFSYKLYFFLFYPSYLLTVLVFLLTLFSIMPSFSSLFSLWPP